MALNLGTKKILVSRQSDVRETSGVTAKPTISDFTNSNHNHSNATGGGTIAHTVLTSIGTNTHAQIDTHIANTSNPHSVTLAQLSTKSHTSLTDIGTNTHAQVDTHLAATAPHSGHVSMTANETIAGNKTFSGNTTHDGWIEMGGNAITGLDTPSAAQDAANKSYVDASKTNFFSGGIGLTTIGTEAEKYAAIQGISTPASTWESNFVMIPRNGTLQNFRTWVTANGTNFTINFYVLKGEDDTTLTTQYTAGQTGIKLDSTHTVSVSAGELIQVHYVAGAGAGTADTIGWSCEIV